MDCGAVHHLCVGMCAGSELDGVPRLSFYRRAWDRRFVGAGSGVHRGAGSGEVARTTGGDFPDQHRDRHLACVSVELRDLATWPWSDGVEMGAWGCRVSRAALLWAAVHDPAECALAGDAGAFGRGAAGARGDGSDGPEGRVGGDLGGDPSG